MEFWVCECGKKVSAKIKECPHCRPQAPVVKPVEKTPEPPQPVIENTKPKAAEPEQAKTAQPKTTKICKHCAMTIPIKARICPFCRKRTGMSIPAIIGLLFVGIIVIGPMVTGFNAYRNKGVANNSKKAAESVSNYFTQSPIGGGWEVSEVRNEGKNVRVKVIIPQAYNIMKNDSEQQFRIVAVCCPSKREPIWNDLEGNDIIIEGATPSKETFIDVSCNRWGN
ncbi:MAG: hypothetical protein PHG20_00965 [Geobacteraceae bacterium]|nr:hypothetical protein [Geobacteraceae bacterium]